ncbi:protein Tma108p [[Candida] railenensis]|uniref:Aminopeptidase n=1 Tax=[Candida] railenensis TaxID=45579 RepID=A0A9P0VYA2_9ASCO|nr:protein Tma108p [[Candida] railenensis]
MSTLLSEKNAFIPSLYKLSLSIDHNKSTFKGLICIDLVANASKFKDSGDFEVTLNSSKIVVTSATLKLNTEISDSQQAEEKLKIVYNKDKEQVTFSKQDVKVVQPQCSLVLEYVGQLNQIKTYSDPTFGLYKTNYLDTVSGTSTNYILATHNQPCFTRKVFPLIDEIGFKVPIKLELETLNKFKAISNAKLESKEPISMSELALFKFKQTPPISGHLFSLVLGDLECRSIDEGDESIPISFYTPIGEGNKAAYPLSVASKILPFLSKQLQTPYPLEKLDFAAIPFLSDVVMENWGLITLLSEQVLNSSSKQQIRQLISHELVHQWVGNLATFNDWKWMWLNESFATWLGNVILKKIEIEVEDKQNFALNTIIEKHQEMVSSNVSISEFTNSLSGYILNCTTSNTGDLFNREVYEKGISLLNMIASVLAGGEENEYTNMLQGVSNFIEKYKYTSASGDELWKCLDERTGAPLIEIIDSFTANHGFPIVEVKLENGNLISSIDQEGFELALFSKSTDGKLKTIITKERKTILAENESSFVCLSNVGYYQVKYSLSVLPSLVANFGRLSSTDLLTVITDYGYFLQSAQDSSPDELIVYVKLMDIFASSESSVDFNVLSVALSFLEKINNILLHYSTYDEFSKWLSNFTVKLSNKIGSWDLQLKRGDTYSPAEMSARNSILLLNLQNPDFQSIGKKLFRNLVNPGMTKPFTPKELIPSIFNLVMSSASQKEYKQVLAFVKNSEGSVLDNTNSSKEYFQTCAISSLSFVNSQDLLSKSLNFVLTNIDSKLIELALIGFQYKHDKDAKLKLFQWYSVNYGTLVLRSLQQNNSWSVQLKSTLHNLTRLILGDIMVFDPELLKLKSDFVEKGKKLPEHGLIDTLSQKQEENDYKVVIGSYYENLIRTL